MTHPNRFPLRALSGCIAACAFALACSAQDGGRDPFVMQRARARSLEAFAERVYYPPETFDLSDLPAYAPERAVTGVLKFWGSDMFGGSGLRGALEEGFQRVQPGVRMEFNLHSNLLAIAGLLDGTAEVGTTHALTWETLLGFQRLYNYDPLTIAAFTGWGVEPPFAIAVNAANPLRSITVRQLDGVFGAARSGGWVGTTWHPDYARGPEKNIRTWGQLGLTGEWADKPIDPYGYAIRCMFGVRFSNAVLQGGDKWNERVQERFNIANSDGKLLSMDQQMADDLARDRYGIAYLSVLRAKNPAMKVLPVARDDGSPALLPTLQTVRNRSYPLCDPVFLYVNRKPGTPLEPALKEFLSFVLSRDGQTIILRDSKMLPLTRDLLMAERRKLE